MTRNSYTGDPDSPKTPHEHGRFFGFRVGKQVEIPTAVRLGTFALAVALVANFTALGAAQDAAQHPTFKGGVSMVSVSAVVRKHNGQWVTGLAENEFEVLDNGVPRPLSAFEATNRGVSIAFLVDYSGSMDIAARFAQVKQSVGQIVDWLTPATDNVALFTFDTRIHEIQPMSPAPSTVVAKLDGLKPFGATSIYDAIAETSQHLTSEGPRRAIVAVTDGADNASKLSPEVVSGIASSIDVPVYIVVVVSPLDMTGHDVTDQAALDATLDGPLANLAHWTGGEIYAANGPAQASTTARAIVTELRQEYWMAFEPGAQPGWHTLEVKTRHKDFVVRARSGYMVPASGNDR